ncbi:tRNA (adenosine(37)-N6)-threonylcarbamoyltransferase complex ATPase subunit type 1 TsaE [Maribacter sp. MMG018]|uniref:tRNA (adenosine(37)-N6)-threonylcarbamoyltransferase complex ATPase subunit type 1 TsaE n=1 Tax=Maribacter sp. MMG018 TaxID=2822688 RepID=UPI001B38A4CC|nr:tRNA (adenosine(37)-N6)-threonylcarbamoyltransferase complex ATPase subunit type 1 TsaE [Maribacter sp. MMG018]MBQ4915197.1 tRNA (adenosine(37)-N6)-threonylcarbamoyltransferase complex ATPase subunit type 1 TsaE [Maribacter sp. MMG018]
MELIYSESEIQEVAKKIIANISNKTVAFYAPMGAGKTTLITAIIKELGSMDKVSSPTFGLVNEYADQKGDLLAYHFDFYRLKDEIEALDMGIEDYFDTDVWIFMEWPDKIPSFLPTDATNVKIEILDTNKRKITF